MQDLATGRLHRKPIAYGVRIQWKIDEDTNRAPTDKYFLIGLALAAPVTYFFGGFVLVYLMLLLITVGIVSIKNSRHTKWLLRVEDGVFQLFQEGFLIDKEQVRLPAEAVLSAVAVHQPTNDPVVELTFRDAAPIQIGKGLSSLEIDLLAAWTCEALSLEPAPISIAAPLPSSDRIRVQRSDDGSEIIEISKSSHFPRQKVFAFFILILFLAHAFYEWWSGGFGKAWFRLALGSYFTLEFVRFALESHFRSEHHSFSQGTLTYGSQSWNGRRTATLDLSSVGIRIAPSGILSAGWTCILTAQDGKTYPFGFSLGGEEYIWLARFLIEQIDRARAAKTASGQVSHQ